MAPVPKPYRGLKASEISNGTKISRHYTLADFTNAPRTRTRLRDSSVLDAQTTLENLQRLCFEALDPATQYVGQKPRVMAGLSDIDNDKGTYVPTIRQSEIKGDSIFEAFAKGEGCSVQFDFENITNLQTFALYIRSSVIFDLCVLRYSPVYDEPSLIVSVNDKARRLVYTMDGQTIVGKGIINLDG